MRYYHVTEDGAPARRSPVARARCLGARARYRGSALEPRRAAAARRTAAPPVWSCAGGEELQRSRRWCSPAAASRATRAGRGVPPARSDGPGGHPWNDGAGLRMGQQAGAALWHMYGFFGWFAVRVPGVLLAVRDRLLRAWARVPRRRRTSLRRRSRLRGARPAPGTVGIPPAQPQPPRAPDVGGVRRGDPARWPAERAARHTQRLRVEPGQLRRGRARLDPGGQQPRRACRSHWSGRHGSHRVARALQQVRGPGSRRGLRS